MKARVKRGLSQETSPFAGLCEVERGTDAALCTGNGADSQPEGWESVCVCVLALRVE